MAHRQRHKQQHMDYLAIVHGKWAEFSELAWLNSSRSLWQSLPRFHRQALAVITPVTLILAVIPLPATQYNETSSSEPERIAVGLDTTPLDETHTTAVTPLSRSQNSTAQLVLSAWISYTVKDGDTLSQVFRANNLPLSDLNALTRIEGSDKPLSDIRPGQLVRYKLNKDGQLDILQLEKSGQSIMFFRLSDGGFGRSE